jgi:hypothetical protein
MQDVQTNTDSSPTFSAIEQKTLDAVQKVPVSKVNEHTVIDKAEIDTQLKAPAAAHDPEKFLHRDYVDYKTMARDHGIVALGQPQGFYGSIFDPNLTIGQFANGFMLQLFDASALAPGQMKDKVLAYQDEVKTILVHYLRLAMETERTRIGRVLEAAGHATAAAMVKKLNF